MSVLIFVHLKRLSGLPSALLYFQNQTLKRRTKHFIQVALVYFNNFVLDHFLEGAEEVEVVVFDVELHVVPIIDSNTPLDTVFNSQ